MGVTFGGVPIITSMFMYDGELYYLDAPYGPTFMLGTMPIDNKEWCRREAKRIVHAGLKDVLEWLGEEPYSPPLGHKEFLATLRR